MKFSEEFLSQLPDHLAEEYEENYNNTLRELYESGMWKEMETFLCYMAEFLEEKCCRKNKVIDIQPEDVNDLLQAFLAAHPVFTFMCQSHTFHRHLMCENYLLSISLQKNLHDNIQRLKDSPSSESPYDDEED